MQTVPETTETLKLQQQQLLNGERSAQMFPAGTRELSLPKNIKRLKTPGGDVFHFRSDMIKTSEILRASKAHRENEILGLGDLNKSDVAKRVAGGEKPIAITERSPEGTEVRSAAATNVTALDQIAKMDAAKTPGHHVGVEHPASIISERLHRADGGAVQMADGGDVEDGPWKDFAPAQEAGPWDDFKPAQSGAKDEASSIPAAIRDVPKEVYQATADAMRSTKEGFVGRDLEKEGPIESVLNTGKGVLSAASVPFAPLVGAARSLLGHPMASVEHAIGTIINPEVAAKDNPDEMYSHAKEGVDTAMSAIAAGRGVRAPVPAPAPPPTGPLGVTLSKGQATAELPLIQREQAALRGQMGDAAQSRAKEFAGQQAVEVDAAKETVAKSFDPVGQRVVETPQEAGALVSDSLRKTAAQRKAAVTADYDFARGLPGEIDADVFRGASKSIKTDLSARAEPIIVDDKLTPFASHAVQDLDNRVSQLFIQNRADPLGAPDPNKIVGVNLNGVDQMRKRLSSFRKQAYDSGNAADGRAAQGVIESFDEMVGNAINGGQFRGDPRAVQAWNDARAAHADYRKTFTAGKNDPTGRVVEKIMGRANNPAAIPNDVADFIYGGVGVNPSSLNVNVANRIKSILGDRSPEWSAVKQGLFSRLTEAGAGATNWGPGKIAQRVNKFLNADGREMSEVLFSATERQMIQAYADLQRKLEIPQAGANWSNTSTILAPILRKISGGLAGIVGAVVGHTVAPGLYGVGEAAGAALAGKVSGAISQIKEAKKITQQMPLVANTVKQWQKAVAAANKANTPPSQAAASLATANLSRALAAIGIKAESVGLTEQVQ